jgi:hypothetical protein
LPYHGRCGIFVSGDISPLEKTMAYDNNERFMDTYHEVDREVEKAREKYAELQSMAQTMARMLEPHSELVTSMNVSFRNEGVMLTVKTTKSAFIRTR